MVPKVKEPLGESDCVSVFVKVSVAINVSLIVADNDSDAQVAVKSSVRLVDPEAVLSKVDDGVYDSAIVPDSVTV